MIHTVKSELRKLLTVRSTYIISGLALLLAAFVNFWIIGYKDVGKAGTNSGVLSDSLLNTASTIGIFIAIVTILMVGHEYRYNTITYSLTSVNRRIKLFAAKYLVLLGFALGFIALTVLLGWACFSVGQSAAGIKTITQHISAWEVAWRSALLAVGMMTYAFIITFILRNLIGAIVLILILPSTVESLLSLLLKDNTRYLPYTALSNLTSLSAPRLTTTLLTVGAYVVIGLAAAYWLFQKRDAN